MHDGGAPDKAQVLRIEVPELRDHFLGQAVAEVLLAGVSSEVLERENRQHQSSTGRLGGAARERDH
jgi:hypothetical protein